MEPVSYPFQFTPLRGIITPVDKVNTLDSHFWASFGMTNTHLRLK